MITSRNLTQLSLLCSRRTLADQQTAIPSTTTPDHYHGNTAFLSCLSLLKLLQYLKPLQLHVSFLLQNYLQKLIPSHQKLPQIFLLFFHHKNLLNFITLQVYPIFQPLRHLILAILLHMKNCHPCYTKFCWLKDTPTYLNKSK